MHNIFLLAVSKSVLLFVLFCFVPVTAHKMVADGQVGSDSNVIQGFLLLNSVNL